MSFHKQWNGFHVCVCCSLRSSKRAFSSSRTYNNAAPASQQSAQPSTFENPYFQPTPSSLHIPQGVHSSDSASPGQPQENNQGPQGTTEPSVVPDVASGRKSLAGLRLFGAQVESIAVFGKVTKRLFAASQLKGDIDDGLKHVLQQRVRPREKKFIDILSSLYAGRTIQDVALDLRILEKLSQGIPVDTSAEDLVARLEKTGLLGATTQSLMRNVASPKDSAAKSAHNKQALQPPATASTTTAKGRKSQTREVRRLRNEGTPRKRKEAAGKNETAAQTKTPGSRSTLKRKADIVTPASKEKHQFTSTIEASALSILQLSRTGPAVPTLCHDLSRVLFNPGIYQLQDPRSRVFNFDPYLEKIMPVSEFDFKILKEYITSSRDQNLRSLALEHGKRYVGSSSSMTSTLSQFHYLLSQWRDINTAVLSKGFSDTLKSFTIMQRTASSVFLRYQDGVYAMDADKEYDSGNILTSLGRSMEKLLTLKPQDYERYRKTSEVKIPEEERMAPEAYQYTHSGDLLMRAQLDAYDSRLPGTGTFDLKTRAVASIRHNIKQHEEGFGYQIKNRYGDWESYEREYYDMMRSVFLKYSLQVRLGQMDGIFVAFHNVERIFGFQYVSLPEMDMTLHGQYDTTLGDQEFKMSVELLNRVLNRVTERFPGRSLRLQFETRDLPAAGVYMHIFAEPMDEASIDAIQTSRKEAIDAFEQRLMNPEMHAQSRARDDPEAMCQQHKTGPDVGSASPTPPSLQVWDDPATAAIVSRANGQPVGDGVPVRAAEKLRDTGPLCDDKAPIDAERTAVGQSPAQSDANIELLALTLRIRNKVNGAPVKRPHDLTSSDKWSLEYSLEETSEAQARAQYRASKARRRTALAERAENSAASYYLRKLREMAARGAEWRKVQDELDAGRKRVVLYEN